MDWRTRDHGPAAPERMRGGGVPRERPSGRAVGAIQHVLLAVPRALPEREGKEGEKLMWTKVEALPRTKYFLPF